MKNSLILLLACTLIPQVGLAQADSTATSFFAKPEGTELALVIVKPFAERRSLNPDQQESIAKIGNKIDSELERLASKSVGEMASGLVAKLGSMKAESGFKEPMEALKASTEGLISSLNSELPANNPLVYSLYLLPIPQGGMPSPIPVANPVTSFEPARWETSTKPFQFGEAAMQAHIIEPKNSIGEAALQGKIMEALRAALSAFTADSKFVIAGVAVHVSLLKDKSEIKLQVLSGLKPAEIPFVQENEQVSITQVVVPAPASPELNQVALLSMQADLQAQSRANKKVKLEFGSFYGLNRGSYGNWFGSFMVTRVITWADGSTDNLCHDRFQEAGQNIIAIEGTLKRGAIANRFLQEKFGALFERLNPKARFRIFDLNFNPDNLAVEDLNVRVDVATDISLLQFGCLNQKDVREQFEGEFNKSIQELLGITDSRGQQFAEQMFLAVYTI